MIHATNGLRTCGRVATLWRHQPTAAHAAAAQCGLLHRQQLRFRSDVADEDKYLELKQLRDIKSEEFYDRHGQERRYFYYIDLQGRLFLENTRPKNIATSLKSAKFLKFFFSQIRPNDANAVPVTEDEELQFLEYPYRSPCGKEMNFIKCADRPFVFEDFYQDEKTDKWVFAYGGGELKAAFQPEKLKISLSTGRLYHDIKDKYAASGSGQANISVALIKSQLAVEFGRHINVLDEPVQRTLSSDGRDNGDKDVTIIGEFKWQGEAYPIQAIEKPERTRSREVALGIMGDKKRECTAEQVRRPLNKRAKPATTATHPAANGGDALVTASCSAFTWQSVEASAKQATLDAIASSSSSPAQPAAEIVHRLFANARVVFLTSDEQSWVFHVPHWYRKLFTHTRNGAAPTAKDTDSTDTTNSSTITNPFFSSQCQLSTTTAYTGWLRCVWNLHPKHHDSIQMFGKDVPMPRFQQVYGGDEYRFSGKSFAAQPIPSELAQCIEIMQKMVTSTTATTTETHSQSYLNGALVNWYADGEHYMGPHTDNEKELIARSPVFSLSLGSTRRFVFTRKAQSGKPSVSSDKDRLEFMLQDGDLLVMGGTTQETHKHALPKMKKCLDRRVNVTLRCFKQKR